MSDTVKYARVILVSTEPGQPLDREIYDIARVRLAETCEVATVYEAGPDPAAHVPTGRHTLRLELEWTDPEERRNYEAQVARRGPENVVILQP